MSTVDKSARGECRLCLNGRELLSSHVFPVGVFKRFEIPAIRTLTPSCLPKKSPFLLPSSQPHACCAQTGEQSGILPLWTVVPYHDAQRLLLPGQHEHG